MSCEKSDQRVVYDYRRCGRAEQFPAGRLLRRAGGTGLSRRKDAQTRVYGRVYGRGVHGDTEFTDQLFPGVSGVYGVYADGDDSESLSRDRQERRFALPRAG